jgi:hypothetical protein
VNQNYLMFQVVLQVIFYGAATVWTLLVAWPFMRDTRRAAVEGLALSIATSEALEAIVRDVRGLAAELRACTYDVDRERVDKLLKAVESLPGLIEGMGAKDILKRL